MRKLSILSIAFLVITASNCFAQIDSVLISDVKFKDSKFDNSHAGSGFLLKYKGKVYGVTAKHVLFFAKTDRMKTVSFGDDLKSWEFVSKTSPTKRALAGKLLNENPKELMEMPPKGDWLIFEIEGKIPKEMAIYSLRVEPLEEGEEVRFLGYPYKAQKPISINGSFIGFTQENNLRLKVPKGVYGGCSGGPVLDEKGKLVGIVSMGYFNKKENKMIFEPASLNYFKEIIENRK